jgi:hypothetical protein
MTEVVDVRSDGLKLTAKPLYRVDQTKWGIDLADSLTLGFTERLLDISAKVPKTVVIAKACIPAGCLDVGFTTVCSPKICTPELASPSFSKHVALYCAEKTPPSYCLFKTSQGDVASKTDTSVIDKNRAPWTLGGFSPKAGAPIVLDPNRAPVPVIAAPVGVYEGDWFSYKSDQSRTSDCSSDVESQSLSATWDFGDGTPTATGASPQHVYPDNGAAHAATGSYTLRLTQDDGRGYKTTATRPVTIENRPPTITTVDQAIDEGAVLNGGPYAAASSRPPTTTPALPRPPRW